MTATAIAIAMIMYIHRYAIGEGFLTSFVLASERSLACTMFSLLTAVAVLLLSAVVDLRLMPLMTTRVPTLFGIERPGRDLSALGRLPLLSEARPMSIESSASGICGPGSEVNTMLSI